MKSKSDNILLREYIRNSLLLSEDYDGGFGSYDLGYGMGMMYGTSDYNALVDTFITPFTDVFKTAVASAKMVTVDAANLLRIAFRAAITTIIPFIGARYDDIWSERDSKINAIKSEYKDVFDRTDAAFSGADAKLLAFMIDPATFLAGSALVKSPAVIKDVLSVASGGFFDTFFDDAKSTWDKLPRRIQRIGKGGSGRFDFDDDRDDFFSQLAAKIREKKSLRRESTETYYDRILFEAESGIKEKDSESSEKEFLTQLLRNKKVVAALSDLIKSNPKIQDIREKMSKVEDESLKKADVLGQTVTKQLKTLPDIEKFIGSDAKAKQSLEKLKSIQDPKERQKSIDLLVSNIKDSSKQLFLSTLEARKKVFPQGSEEYKKYQASIDKLKSV